jgi:hypothetical protein
MNVDNKQITAAQESNSTKCTMLQLNNDEL